MLGFFVFVYINLVVKVRNELKPILKTCFNIFMNLARKIATLILLIFLQSFGQSFAEEPFIKIGILSHRGDDFTLNAWNPTARYLTNKLPEYDFEIIPLNFDEVDQAVRKNEVDFILVNPGIYVNLEYKYRVSRLATMHNLRGDVGFKEFEIRLVKSHPLP
jgi:two-component system sensor histidine kinase TtrS